jgi:hypothetical protein
VGDGQFQIRDVRISFIWTRCHLNILRDPRAESRLDFLGQQFEYERRFREGRTDASTTDGLDRPWVVPPGQPFWSQYLEGAELSNVSARAAWRASVPFWKRLEYDLDAPGWPVRIVPHGFYYPHGVGLVLEITSRETRGLADLVDRVTALKNDGGVALTQRGGNRSVVPLSSAVSTLMAHLGRELIADVFEPQIPTPSFDVITVVSATGRNLPPPVADEGLHRALDGLAQSNLHWQATKPQPMEKASISFGPVPESHVVYASPRARVVWRPLDFLAAPPRRTLSTFHRDLVLTSLQIESLVKFLEKTSELIDQDLQAAHRDCARVAHQLVGRLYGGRTTVPPHSLRRQIDDNGYASPINAIRAFFGQPELTAKE